MKAMKLFLAGAVLVAMVSCTGAQKKKDAVQQEAPATSEMQAPVAYYGTYEGTLPCADCEGIKTLLTINEDTTYALKSEYLGKKEAIFEESGTYNVLNGDVIELVTPSSGEKTYYKILEGAVALTADSTGTLNDGELAEHYILKKK